MGCCVFAVAVIAHWLSLWDRLRFFLACTKAKILRRSLPQEKDRQNQFSQPIFSVGRNGKMFIIMEVLVLVFLALHEVVGTGHDGLSHGSKDSKNPVHSSHIKGDIFISYSRGSTRNNILN